MILFRRMWLIKLKLLLLLCLLTCVQCICDEDKDKNAVTTDSDGLEGKKSLLDTLEPLPTASSRVNRVPMPAFLRQLNSTTKPQRGQVKIFERSNSSSKERQQNSKERSASNKVKENSKERISSEEKEQKERSSSSPKELEPEGTREIRRLVDISEPLPTPTQEIFLEDEDRTTRETRRLVDIQEIPSSVAPTAEAFQDDENFSESSARSLVNDEFFDDEPEIKEDNQPAGTGNILGKLLSLKSSMKAAKFKNSPLYKRPSYRPTSRPTIVIPPTTLRPTTERPFDYEDNGDLVPLFPSSGGGGSSLLGGGGSSATVVPILGVGGTRDLGNYDDYDEESVTEIIFPPSLTKNRLGRQRTSNKLPLRRLVGVKSTKPTILKTQEVEINDPDIVRDFVFSDIKCYRTRSKEYFGAKIHMQADTLPYIRDRPSDPLTSSSCKMESLGSKTFQMSLTDLRGCGVEVCGDQEMCLTMVFPKVSTLALADDEVTTIKCAPQKSTMSEVRTISFAGDSLENRRSSSTVTGGKQDFAAEVGVFRQASGISSGLYSKRVNSGGVVKLGESLQLRSVVRGGDGWTYSKLTDVKVWRMRDGYRHSFDTLNPNDASEVITLVDTRGCRNTEYKVIATSHPLRDPRNDLVHHFTFKAFLFRGQRSNEPLIVTAKVQACQDEDGCADDCGIASSSRLKREDEPVLNNTDANAARLKRSPTEVKNISSIVHDWNSYVALRVVGPNEQIIEEEDDFYYEQRKQKQPSCIGQVIGAGFIGCFVMLICCTVGLAGIVICRRKGRRANHRQGAMNIRYANTIHPISNGLRSDHQAPRTQNAGNGNGRNGNGNGGPVRDQNGNNTSPSNESRNKTSRQQEKSVGNSASNKQKPLPPIPASNNNKLSQDHEDEYESIPEKDFYVVYYCDKRSTSAPPSLRLRRIVGGEEILEADAIDDDGEEDSSDALEPAVLRRTVRSLKRGRKKNRYRKGGSLKVHKIRPSSMTTTTDENTSSDSAYSGSSYASSSNNTQKLTADKKVLPTPKPRTTLNASRESLDNILKTSKAIITSSSKYNDDNVNNLFGRSKQKATTIGNPCSANSAANNGTQMTHFVTRNDSSTQIIIIPETNV